MCPDSTYGKHIVPAFNALEMMDIQQLLKRMANPQEPQDMDIFHMG